jgi:hypothetical protein
VIRLWFKGLCGWFRAYWRDWLVFIAYIGILYGTASQNWQVTHFPAFISLFAIISFGLVLIYRYLKNSP